MGYVKHLKVLVLIFNSSLLCVKCQNDLSVALRKKVTFSISKFSYSLHLKQRYLSLIFN